jgi:Uma2 family endonuclease
MSESLPSREHARPAMTLEEWSRLPEDEDGELMDGRLVEEEMPDYVHEVIVGWLLRVLGAWVVPLGGLAGGSGAKFALRPGRGRKPDVTVFLPGRELPPRRGLVRIPPDLAVEVVSATPRDRRRDRIEKVEEYAAFGVRWYWIVEPDAQSIEILELAPDGRYAHAFSAVDGVHPEVPGCPGLVLDLDALWSEVARLGPTERD